MNTEQTKKVTLAELVVRTVADGTSRTEFHGSNAAGDVVQFAEGVRAVTLAFLARRAGLPVRDVHLARAHA